MDQVVRVSVKFSSPGPTTAMMAEISHQIQDRQDVKHKGNKNSKLLL